MDIACLVAQRSTCLRRKVGAIAVLDRRILATGYNGAPSGVPHCLEVGLAVGLAGRVDAVAHLGHFVKIFHLVGLGNLFQTIFGLLPSHQCYGYILLCGRSL